MSKKYDVESFVRDIETTLKTKLNDVIDAINTEKNDTIILKNINDNAYAFQTLNDKVLSYSPFVFYYIQDIQGTGIGPATSQDIALEVVIILEDKQDHKFQYELLRYLRALIELFNNNFNNIKYSKKLTIESLTPVQFRLPNSSKYNSAIGVSIATTII